MPDVDRPRRAEPEYEQRLLRDLRPDLADHERARIATTPLFQVALYGQEATGWQDHRGWFRKQPVVTHGQDPRGLTPWPPLDPPT